MRLLLDTHTLLWWMTNDHNLSALAFRLIEDKNNEPCVSAVSAWEIATKVRLGKLPAAIDLVKNFEPELALRKLDVLAITATHGIHAGSLPGPHKDPFDRMLIAQALFEQMPILSNEKLFDQYGVQRFW